MDPSIDPNLTPDPIQVKIIKDADFIIVEGSIYYVASDKDGVPNIDSEVLKAVSTAIRSSGSGEQIQYGQLRLAQMVSGKWRASINNQYAFPSSIGQKGVLVSYGTEKFKGIGLLKRVLRQVGLNKTVYAIKELDSAFQQAGRAFATRANTETLLFKLPSELRNRIFILSVNSDDQIQPRQLSYRSNKFTWSKKQFDGDELNLQGAPRLTAVQMSDVCKQFYEEVANSHLFYKYNQIRVESTTGPNYFFAITQARYEAIASLTVQWSTYNSWPMVFLKSLKGLQSLHLQFPYDFQHYFWDRKNLPAGARVPAEELDEYEDLCEAVRGLTRIEISMIKPRPLLPGISNPGSARQQAERKRLCTRTKNFCEDLQKALEEYIQGERVISRGALNRFRDQQLVSKLDIHGDGRLSEDRKPGVVASRTRSQGKANYDRTDMNPDGTLKTRAEAKYDMAGEYAWQVGSIQGHRIAADHEDTGLSGIEFKVRPFKFSICPRNYPESWEDAIVLNSWSAIQSITQYFHPRDERLRANGKVPGTGGLDVMKKLLSFWKAQGCHDDDNARCKNENIKRLKMYIKKLEDAKVKEDAIARRAEVRKMKREIAEEKKAKAREAKEEKANGTAKQTSSKVTIQVLI
ncbi:hypothetical protein B0J14DRAFT_664248 [Halenospora varia]|nr:hypothetical protein B0J14DRAFT_664248 [Halenospora varia]